MPIRTESAKQLAHEILHALAPEFENEKSVLAIANLIRTSVEIDENTVKIAEWTEEIAARR